MQMRFLAGAFGIAFVLLGLAPGTAAAAPPLMHGVVLDASTGTAVGGVTVQAQDPVDLTLIAGDVTTDRGRYLIRGLSSDEYALYVDGSGAGYESGYLSCFGEIVPTYGEACTTSPGRLGPIALDRI